jgi:ribonuclease P protein component
MAHPYRFPRAEHLKRKKDIQRVFKKGKTVSCYGAKLFYIETACSVADAGGSSQKLSSDELSSNELCRRIAFTFPRKFGNAVQRNRSRRLSREAYRHLRPQLKGGWDMVLLVFPGEADYARRCTQLAELCRKAGILRTLYSPPSGGARGGVK